MKLMIEILKLSLNGKTIRITKVNFNFGETSNTVKKPTNLFQTVFEKKEDGKRQWKIFFLNQSFLLS